MSEEGEKEPPKSRLSQVADRMYNLFRGNIRSTGVFNPKSGKATTLDRPPTVDDFIAHIKGSTGVGVVPIMDDGTCLWAALDIDNHGEDTDIPIAPLEEKAMVLGLPLVMCRSKSGGVHAYCFFAEPMQAHRVKALMAEWARKLGHDGCEVFPKQNKLHKMANGSLSFGNWINLPYMGGKETVRYAIRAGEKIGLLDFLDLAESKKLTAKMVMSMVTAQYTDAPPCIMKVLQGLVVEGNRNEALFNAVVYLRKAFPDNFAERAAELNPVIFTKALAKAEFTRTVASAGRPDYSYRCNEEPMRSWCNKEICLASAHGITAKDAETLDLIQELPVFSDLIKYVTEPIRWELSIGGCRVMNLPTNQLLDWRIMRELIAEKLLRVVPMIKSAEWERILVPLMATARVIETPDDASVAGVVRLRLKEFAAKTDLLDKGDDPHSRKALLRGLPCVQEMDGERYVIFRGQDFINYLKRTKSEELKGTNLWFAVKDIGVEHSKIRVGDHSINTWRVPVDVITQGWAEAEAPNFTVEI